MFIYVYHSVLISCIYHFAQMSRISTSHKVVGKLEKEKLSVNVISNKT